MADRKTRDALLRLRRVTEVNAQRTLVEARAELTASRAASEQAAAICAEHAARLSRATGEETPRTAGRLASRERFLERLRSAWVGARKRAAAFARAARDAEARLHEAQAALKTALRAREAAESQEAALVVSTKRQRARREESANQDRYAGHPSRLRRKRPV